MKYSRRSQFRHFFLTGSLLLSLSSCGPKDGGTEAKQLYEEAERLANRHRYEESLDLYDKALAADTLHGVTPAAVDALCRKNRIEFLTGNYFRAFHTLDAIRRHSTASLADSLHEPVLVDTAKMYAELGMYGKASSTLASLRTPDPWQRFDQAALFFKAGDVAGAAGIFGDLSLSEDPAIRMAALSGLLDCSLAAPGSVPDTPDRYAGKIAAVSAEVLRMTTAPELKIRALRIAARSLTQLEKQRPNASYLLFRALAIAQEGGLSRLVPILQYESNTIIVRKPDTYRSVIEYFGQKNMPYAKVAALCMLGYSPELTSAERIDALRSALAACRYYDIPPTATGYAALVKEASGHLCDLLIAEGRYIELFDLDAQASLLDARSRLLAGITEFRLPAGHEQLQNEIIALNREIAALFQRKIGMVEEGTGFRFAELTDKAIARKQGRLIELIAEASKIDETVARRLQPEPLTLRTLQQSLRPDQAVVRIFMRDSLTTSMLVSNREMQIVTAAMPAAEVAARFASLKKRVPLSGVAALSADPQRNQLSAAMLQSMSQRLAAYRRIIFISAHPEPFHLLGQSSMLGRGHEVSWVVSSDEAITGRSSGTEGGIAVFDAMDCGKAQVHKRLHPEDRVFLSWKPVSEQEYVGLKKELNGKTASTESASAYLKRLASDTGSEAGKAWLWLGAYGSE